MSLQPFYIVLSLSLSIALPLTASELNSSKKGACIHIVKEARLSSAEAFERMAQLKALPLNVAQEFFPALKTASDPSATLLRIASGAHAQYHSHRPFRVDGRYQQGALFYKGHIYRDSSFFSNGQGQNWLRWNDEKNLYELKANGASQQLLQDFPFETLYRGTHPNELPSWQQWQQKPSEGLQGERNFQDIFTSPEIDVAGGWSDGLIFKFDLSNTDLADLREVDLYVGFEEGELELGFISKKAKRLLLESWDSNYKPPKR